MKNIHIVGLVVVMIGLVGFGTYVAFSPNERAEEQIGQLSGSVQSELVTDSEEYEIDAADFVRVEDVLVESNGGATLTSAERAGLLLMREEEKLARDVYLTLYEQWNLSLFQNIAVSEETHMETMRTLLERYAVPDPVMDDGVGRFTDSEMQRLYDDLIAEGARSLEAALAVGAVVEELDIHDLDRLMAETDKLDIINVYANLQKGSRNHLRAFDAQLVRRNVSYTPQYISQEAYTAIITSPQERGRI